jgi:hypothetical protein
MGYNSYDDTTTSCFSYMISFFAPCNSPLSFP